MLRAFFNISRSSSNSKMRFFNSNLSLSDSGILPLSGKLLLPSFKYIVLHFDNKLYVTPNSSYISFTVFSLCSDSFTQSILNSLL